MISTIIGKNACKILLKANNKMYVNLIDEFGEHMKYSPLVTKTIVERL
jgi:hypothetical protein